MRSSHKSYGGHKSRCEVGSDPAQESDFSVVLSLVAKHVPSNLLLLPMFAQLFSFLVS